MFNKNYLKKIGVLCFYSFSPVGIGAQTFERASINISATKDLGVQLASKASGFLFSAGFDYASAFNFSDKLPVRHVPQMRFKIESLWFFPSTYLYANLMVHVPLIDIQQSSLHYRSTRVAYSFAVGFGFPFAQRTLRTSSWVFMTGFALIVPFFKPLTTTDETIVSNGDPSVKGFPGEIGVLWEFRAIGYVHPLVRVIFGLGLEYMSPQLGYTYKNLSTPRSLGSLTLLASFTVAFF